jgi:hypothetical protein
MTLRALQWRQTVYATPSTGDVDEKVQPRHCCEHLLTHGLNYLKCFMDAHAGDASARGFHVGAHMHGAPRKRELMSACSYCCNNNYSCMHCRAVKKNKALMLGSKIVYLYACERRVAVVPNKLPPIYNANAASYSIGIEYKYIIHNNTVTSQDVSFKST